MSDFRNKRILVWGLGLHTGGVGTVKFLVKRGAKVTVTDLRSRRELAPALKKLRAYKNIKYVLGRHRNADFLNSDLIVKNPAIKPDSPYLKLARAKKIPVTSDIGIFFKIFPGKIIGVTGTRGKSTTTYLIWKFLKTKFKRVFIGGNIRKSVLELPLSYPESIAVLELSSFQLDDFAAEKRSPQIAVLTNILKDHLNWHRDFKDYVEAKKVIFKFQRPQDLFFINPKNKLVLRLSQQARSKVIKATLPKNLQDTVDANLGRHYREAAGLAVAVAKQLGVRDEIIRKTLKNFRGLEGRQELINTVRGIKFINDTTSTIPEATEAALERVKHLKKSIERIILIAGGEDKGLNYAGLAKRIAEDVEILILLPGTATNKLKAQISKLNLDNFPVVKNTKSMREAVQTAYNFAKKGDWIILSPGAASFNLFLNEFDRGRQFVEEVRKLRSS